MDSEQWTLLPRFAVSIRLRDVRLKVTPVSVTNIRVSVVPTDGHLGAAFSTLTPLWTASVFTSSR